MPVPMMKWMLRSLAIVTAALMLAGGSVLATPIGKGGGFQGDGVQDGSAQDGAILSGARPINSDYADHRWIGPVVDQARASWPDFLPFGPHFYGSHDYQPCTRRDVYGDIYQAC